MHPAAASTAWSVLDEGQTIVSVEPNFNYEIRSGRFLTTKTVCSGFSTEFRIRCSFLCIQQLPRSPLQQYTPWFCNCIGSNDRNMSPLRQERSTTKQDVPSIKIVWVESPFKRGGFHGIYCKLVKWHVHCSVRCPNCSRRSAGGMTVSKISNGYYRAPPASPMFSAYLVTKSIF
jgi:hypothetical protein